MCSSANAYTEIDGTFLINIHHFKLDFDHVTAVSSLMDRLLDCQQIAYSTEIQCVRE